MTIALYIGNAYTIEAIVVDGNCIVQQFIDALDISSQKKVIALLRRTADLGPPVNEEKFKKLTGEELFEFKSYQVRIICAFEKGKVIILTHGFLKKGPKTPRNEIDRASKLLSHYRCRRNLA